MDKEIAPTRLVISHKNGQPWKLGAGAFGQVGLSHASDVAAMGTLTS